MPSVDTEALADLVVQTIKAALAPLLERVARAETRLDLLPALDRALAEVRDRVGVAETTLALPGPAPVDLGPVQARVEEVRDRLLLAEGASLPRATVEQAIGALRDRVLALEVTPPPAAAPPINLAAALAPLVARVATVEGDVGRAAEALDALPLLRDRVVAAEMRATTALNAPPPPLTPPVDLAPVCERLARLEAEGTRAAADGIGLADLRDRLVAAEVKADRPAPVEAAPVDLSPIFERLGRMEAAIAGVAARAADLPGLRDRLTAAEAAIDAPVPVDLTPVYDRLGSLDAAVAHAVAAAGALPDLRDRVVAAETRAAQAPAAWPDVPPPVDLTPVYDRLGSLDASLAQTQAAAGEVPGLRDRIVAAETRAALPTPTPDRPVPVDLTPVYERLAHLDATVRQTADAVAVDLPGLRDRIVAAETRAAQPAALPDRPAEAVDLAPVYERLAHLDVTVRQATDAVAVDLPGLRDRIVAAETRAGDVGAPPVAVDLAPVYDRLARVEAGLTVAADVRARDVGALTGALDPLRDRVAAAEAAAARRAPDLAPLTERIARAEAAALHAEETATRAVAVTDVLPDLRDRLVVVETHAARTDLGPILARLATAEARLVEATPPPAAPAVDADALTVAFRHSLGLTS